MPFRQKDLTESLTELLCCVVYSLSQSSLSGETAQYNGYLFFSTARTKQLFTALVLWLLLELPISLSCTIIIWGLLASLHLYDKDVDQLLPARPFLSLLQSWTAYPTMYLCM